MYIYIDHVYYTHNRNLQTNNVQDEHLQTQCLKGTQLQRTSSKILPALHMVPLCGYFGPQVEVNDMYTSAAQNVSHETAKVGPKHKKSQRSLYFF